VKVEVIRKCRRTVPHLLEDGWLYASSGPRVMRSADLGETWYTIGWLYRDWRAMTAGVRLTDRALSHGAFNLVRLPDGGLFAITGKTQRYLPIGARVFEPVAGPVDYRPMRRGVWVDTDGAVVVADYRSNGGEYGESNRQSVRIQRWHPATRTWEPLHAFAKGTIRHIHAVVPDPFVAGRIWLSTGDGDAECQIVFSDDGLRTITEFLSGSQSARAADLLFTETHVYWGVETPRGQSGIARRAREGGDVEWLETTPCPVYYGATNEAGHFAFSTTVEPGPGVSGNHTEIYASGDRARYDVVWSERSDPSRQFAQTQFPRGVAPGATMVWGLVATRRHEGAMFVGRLIPG